MCDRVRSVVCCVIVCVRACVPSNTLFECVIMCVVICCGWLYVFAVMFGCPCVCVFGKKCVRVCGWLFARVFDLVVFHVCLFTFAKGSCGCVVFNMLQFVYVKCPRVCVFVVGVAFERANGCVSVFNVRL